MDCDIKSENYSISNNNSNNINNNNSNSNIDIIINKNDDDDDDNKHVIHIEDDSPTATTTINSVEDNLVDANGSASSSGGGSSASNVTTTTTSTATTNSSSSELRRQHYLLQEQRYRHLQQQRQQQRHVNSRSINITSSSSLSSSSPSSLSSSLNSSSSSSTNTSTTNTTTTTTSHNNYRNNNKHVDKTFGLLKCDSECVPQEKLVEFLASKPKFNQAVMIRKGRQIMRKDLVGIEEGPNGFLTDIFHPVFAITPSRRCIVVKEDLLCNGEGSCRRKCGGIGDCIVDCPKKTERAKMGHRCSFKVLLTMHSDQIGMWEVKLIGSHVEPEYAWVPPIKKVKWRKVQSHTKALKKALQHRKNSVLQFDWPLKPSFAAEKKENTEFLIQTNSFEKSSPSTMESSNISCGLSSSQLSQMFVQKEEAAFEEFPTNNDQMVNCNSSSSGQLAVYSTAGTTTANQNSMVYQKVELCDDYDDYYIDSGHHHRAGSGGGGGGGTTIVDDCGIVVLGGGGGGVGGGVVDDDDEDNNEDDDNADDGYSSIINMNFTGIHNTTATSNNSSNSNNNNSNIKTNSSSGSTNAVASAASSAAAAAAGGMIRLLPMSSASAASSAAAAAAAASAAATAMDFSEAAVGKSGRIGVGGSGGGNSLEEVVEDTLSFEEHLLDFHRAEHEQRMAFMSQEHLAKMEVIALEKDIALLKRQKLVNELGASLKKCDNILLTEQ